MKVSWVTPAGTLGIFQESLAVSVTLAALPETVGDTVSFVLLNGTLPSGLTLSTAGILSGTLAVVNVNTDFEFTVRVTETGTTPSISDRTFSMTVEGPDAPYFDSSQPNMLTTSILDSEWVSIDLVIVNPDSSLLTTVILDSGTLPPGLEVTTAGTIRGYPLPPTTSTATFSFTLAVSSASGSNTVALSITVMNQALQPGFIGRRPAILNTRPLTLYVPYTDEYSAYYTSSSGDMGRFAQADELIFKIIGYNFDIALSPSVFTDEYTDDLTYTVTGLSAGLPSSAFSTLVTDGSGLRGWINGTLATLGADIVTHSFTVSVHRTSQPTLVSDTVSLTLTIVGAIDDTVTWVTEPELGTLDNGAISNLIVSAHFGQGITGGRYRLVSGTLPVGLEILSDGNISGRVAFKTPFQSYTFTIEAYSPQHPSASNSREFTLTILETYTVPYDTIYMKALSGPNDRERINNLLTNIRTNHINDIYRPNDHYFGLASDIRYDHMYGVPSVSNLNPLNPADLHFFNTIYTNAIQQSFYWRQVTLGELKTAVAKDNNGDIIYEVVYCQLIDDLVNSGGESVTKDIVWPRPILTNTNPNVFMNQIVHPNSLPNMRQHLADMLGKINSSSLLPRWMTSQQSNGSVLGYVPCWVICYTLPDKSNSILTSINSYMASSTSPLKAMNQISFELDRFEVDRSMTYTWGQTTPEQWPPAPTSSSVLNDSQDSYVYFPRKTILVP